jgi:hypothetical protein
MGFRLACQVQKKEGVYMDSMTDPKAVYTPPPKLPQDTCQDKEKTKGRQTGLDYNKAGNK